MLGAVRRVRGGPHRTFAQPVGLDHDPGEGIEHLVENRHGQGGRAGACHLDAGEVVGLEIREGDEGDEELRGSSEQGGLVLDHRFKVLPRFEPRKDHHRVPPEDLIVQVPDRAHGVKPGDDHERSLTVPCRATVSFRVHARGKDGGYLPVDHLDLGPGEPVSELERIGHHVEVGEGDPFRQARRSARVGEVHQVFSYIDRDFRHVGFVLLQEGGHVDGVRDLGLPEGLEGGDDRVVAVRDAGRYDPLDTRLGQDVADARIEQVERNQCLCARIVELMPGLPGGQQRAQRGEDRPDLQGPVVGNGELRAIGQVDGDTVPLLHAHAGQGRGEALAQFFEFPVGQLHAPENDRDPVRDPLCCLVEEGVDRNVRVVQALGPSFRPCVEVLCHWIPSGVSVSL